MAGGRSARSRPRIPESGPEADAAKAQARARSLADAKPSATDATEPVPTSRLCVKNIPKYATEQRVRAVFASQGLDVTDVKVLRTKAGASRQMAFVGFREVDAAARMLKYFNKSYFDTCRLDVGFALPYGDSRLARPWSKHSAAAGAAAGGKRERPGAGDDGEGEKKRGKKESNKKLAEFLSLMQPRSQQQFWANDDQTRADAGEGEGEGEGEAGAAAAGEGNADEDSSDSDSDDDNANEEAKAAKKEKKEKKKKKKKEDGAEEDSDASGAGDSDGDDMEQDSDDDDDDDDRRVEPDVAVAAESGRIFVRNLSYDTTEAELEAAFKAFGPVSETHIPLDDATRSRGFGYVTFMIPEHAVKALGAMDMTIFQGRLVHVMAALDKPEGAGGAGGEGGGPADAGGKSGYKAQKEAERKEKAGDVRSWNALFVRSDAAVGAVAAQLGVAKSALLLEDDRDGDGDDDGDGDGDGGRGASSSAAVRQALSEAQVVAETKRFLADEGVDVELLERGVRDPASVPRSRTSFLVKNLPAATDSTQLRQMFAKFGDVRKFVLPPSKTMALVAFFEAKRARRAFQGLAYKRYKRVPIYLEWAPENSVTGEQEPASEVAAEAQGQAEAEVEVKVKTKAEIKQAKAEAKLAKAAAKAAAKAKAKQAAEEEGGDDSASEEEKDEEEGGKAGDSAEAERKAIAERKRQQSTTVEDSHTLFVKNLNFDTTEQALFEHFARLGGDAAKVITATIPSKDQEGELSMGFGFVEFADAAACKRALRKARGSTLDTHAIEASISQRKKGPDGASASSTAAEAGAGAGASRKASSGIGLRASEQATGTKVVIRNLAFQANAKELRQLVAAYGQVRSVRVPRKADGSIRGFAFVDFVTPQEAKTAFQALANTHFYGRHLVIEWAQDDTSMESMRAKASRALLA